MSDDLIACLAQYKVSIPKGAIMRALSAHYAGLVEVSIPKGAIMSKEPNGKIDSATVVSIPKGAIMRRLACKNLSCDSSFNSKRCDYEGCLKNS